MLKVGLSGGIGSGKTTVARFFQILGINIYFADERAKFLIDNNKEVIDKIKLYFGQIYTPQGIDKKKLAAIIFTNPEKLETINSIVHPAVRKDFDNWCNQFQNEKYVIQEAAILFESGFYKFMDKTIAVSAEMEERIDRVMKRNGVSKKQVIERINNQISDDERNKLSDFVIKNDNSNLVIPQILKIHQELISYSSF